jgi:hypothetical protein
VPGRHVSLVVDVTPLTGMHVYAPGATGYRVVALTLDEVPGLRALDTSYPPSETYYFAPLKERVPVYMRAFRLTREVLLDPSPQGAAALGARTSLTVSGRLDYQACDDEICYNPVSIPLSWSFTLEALDRERARPLIPIGMGEATVATKLAAWARLAVRPSTVRRSAPYALVVGSVLTIVNHGDALMAGDWSRQRVMLLSEPTLSDDAPLPACERDCGKRRRGRAELELSCA